MAGRNWNRNGPAYGGGGGFMGSGMGGMNFYGGPPDRRPMYSPGASTKPFYGGNYREEPYRRDRRDDYRGGKRGPQKNRSPGGEKRGHQEAFGARKDGRTFGKRQQAVGRYDVKIPKAPLCIASATFPELRHMHPKLTVPVDMCKASMSWQEGFPLFEPMKLGNKTDIYVLHRDVESTDTPPATALDASDADYSFSVRVMLMASPELGELYKNTCRLGDEPTTSDKTPVGKNIFFLIGGRAKNETVGIGGPWSPSLDGTDPDTNPQTLINTAIRTFKGATGIDLSSCTDWTRFMELRYYRCADSKAPTLTETEEERDVSEDKQEVVVFLIPNASHLVPTEEAWTKTKEHYGAQLQEILAASATKVEDKEKDKVKDEEKDKTDTEPDTSQIAETSIDESEGPVDGSAVEPTHFSKLDTNTLKVTELRRELSARALDTKGVKASLVARLQATLEKEKSTDSGEATKEESEPKTEQTPTKTTAAASQPKEETKELSEKDRRRLERLYRLGDKPAILVHPNRAARGGRFDCHRVSLYSLLDYRTEDMKEHNFEVSLFAEQFHEMLLRDCAFNIFKAVYSAPEKEPKSDGKTENGPAADEIKEPDSKRRRNESGGSQLAEEEVEGDKVRRLRRTIDPQLLFSFTYLDVGHAGFIRDYDLVELFHLLGLGYSKSQMKKLVSKVTTRRDHVQYRQLTDRDVVQGDSDDVVNFEFKPEDKEFLRDLAAGNDLLFGGEKPLIPAKAVIAGNVSTTDLLKRLQQAEDIKKEAQLKFFQIKDELEKTRVRLNACKDTEDKLRSENRDYQNRLKDEQKNNLDNKQLVTTYNHLLKVSRDHMTTAVSDITKQFDKEKAKRDAEKAAVEAEKKKAEEEAKKAEAAIGNGDKVEEKEWEVIDQV